MTEDRYPGVVAGEQQDVDEQDADKEQSAEEVVGLEAEDAAAAWEIMRWDVSGMLVVRWFVVMKVRDEWPPSGVLVLRRRSEFLAGLDQAAKLVGSWMT